MVANIKHCLKIYEELLTLIEYVNLYSITTLLYQQTNDFKAVF